MICLTYHVFFPNLDNLCVEMDNMLISLKATFWMFDYFGVRMNTSEMYSLQVFS